MLGGSSQRATVNHGASVVGNRSPSKVAMQGVFLKRGTIFKRYQNKYTLTFHDNLLTYGKIGKEPNTSIDLREAVVLRNYKSKKVFKIKHPSVKLTLKAENELEREKWVHALTKVAKSYEGEDVSKRIHTDEEDKEHAVVPSFGKKSSRSIKGIRSVTLTQIFEILQKQNAKMS